MRFTRDTFLVVAARAVEAGNLAYGHIKVSAAGSDHLNRSVTKMALRSGRGSRKEAAAAEPVTPANPGQENPGPIFLPPFSCLSFDFACDPIGCDPIGSASESFTQRLLELRTGIPQIESEGNPPEEVIGQTKHERGPGPDAPTQQHEQAKITRYARRRGKSRKPVIFGIEPGLVSWRSSK